MKNGSLEAIFNSFKKSGYNSKTSFDENFGEEDLQEIISNLEDGFKDILNKPRKNKLKNYFQNINQKK
jgi:type III secretory pathway component EscR